MKIFANNNRGYTLMEMIVSISIISIISSILVANYHAGGRRDELNIAAQNLISEIRKVQAYSLSYKEFNGVIQDQGDWSVRLTSNTSDNPENIIIYFDINESGKYDGPAELFYEGQIGEQVFISDIIFDGGTSQDYFWTAYHPPDPLIYLRGDDHPTDASFLEGNLNEVETVEIVLGHMNGSEKSIFVNRFGLVDVD